MPKKDNKKAKETKNKKSSKKTTKTKKTKAAKRGAANKSKKLHANLVASSIPFRFTSENNPAGKPKSVRSIVKYLRDALTCKAAGITPFRERAIELNMDLAHASVGQVLAMSFLSDAMGGRDRLAVEILNRTDGKVPEVYFDGNEMNGNGHGTPLQNLTDTQLERMIRPTPKRKTSAKKKAIKKKKE